MAVQLHFMEIKNRHAGIHWYMYVSLKNNLSGAGEGIHHQGWFPLGSRTGGVGEGQRKPPLSVPPWKLSQYVFKETTAGTLEAFAACQALSPGPHKYY